MPITPPTAFEPLELRRLLTTGFASVGFEWTSSGGAVVVVEEGTISDDGIVSAARFINGLVGLRSSSPPALSRLEFSQGVVDTATAFDASPYGTAFGWDFRTQGNSGRQDLGFLAYLPGGVSAAGDFGGVRFFTETASDATIRDITGNWRFNELRGNVNGGFTVETAGVFFVNASTLTLTSSTGSVYNSEFLPVLSGNLNTPLQNGRADFGGDVRFYLSADFNTILWVDGRYGQGGVQDGAIGIAVRAPATASPDRVSGDFALAFIDTPGGSFTHPFQTGAGQSEPPLRDAILRIRPDGTYGIFSEAFSRGPLETPDRSGAWSLSSGGILTLVDSETEQALRLLPSADYDTLIPVSDISPTGSGGQAPAPRFGLAQRFIGELGLRPTDPTDPGDPGDPGEPPPPPPPPPPPEPESALEVILVAESLVPGGVVVSVGIVEGGDVVQVRIADPATGARTLVAYNIRTGAELANEAEPFDEAALAAFNANLPLYQARTITFAQAVALAEARFSGGELTAIGIDPFLSTGELLYTIALTGTGAITNTVRVDAITGLVTDINGLRVGLTPGEGDARPGYASLDAGNRPVFYRVQDDGSVTATDLFQAAKVTIDPATVRAVHATVDGSTGRPAAVVQTGDGVLYFLQNTSGVWVRQDLTSLDAGARIERALTVATAESTDAVGATTLIVGLDFRGDLILYEQFTINTLGNPLWQARNIARNQLRPTGQVMPELVSELVVYTTPWGGINVAGLDAGGDLHVLWWAPGAASWFASNLSAITGVGDLGGPVTAWVQPWGGINVAATDPSGNLVVHWWSPGNGGVWVASDLTAIAGGPAIDPEGDGATVIDATGSPSVVVIDTDGEVVIYTWDRRLNEWGASDVTRGRFHLDARPVSQLAARIDTNGAFVILGEQPDGTPIQLARQPDGSDWALSVL
ncbi:MAG: hypothetical protein EA378_12190 [Phycisphaerales bacterium]|nr:MAG: hypothetical protein EA378_12190 [Phycisphaerales bacterium]